MTSQSASRKRPAPGSIPIMNQQMQQPQTYPPAADPQLSNDQFLQWGQNASTQPNLANLDPSAYQPLAPGADMAATGGQLTRRPGNQLMSRPQFQDPNLMPLVDPSGLRQGQQIPQPQQQRAEHSDGMGETTAELEQRALLAKKDAQAKRKQIPPFVQKLRSFLDESKNTDLIRWSDDGDSFIVLDEDEFAKTLIPELFKHNNYASFVRQLNMYGFHKKVGLSDNSMRASERKNKSPSEYSNPYFKRGHPDLLWLIQKPKTAPSGGGKGSGKGANWRGKAEQQENEEADNEEYGEDSGARGEERKFKGQLSIEGGQATLPKEQLANVYRELQAIRHQQQVISTTINRLRKEQEQLYGQAATFQEQHNRHENSINAILTFLATVYDRSLRGHEGAQGLVNSFAGVIPQDHTSQGNIVDMGDYIGNVDQQPFRKQPLLLKAPPVMGADGQPVQTIPPSGTSSQYDLSQGSRKSSHTRSTSGVPGNVEEVYDTASPRSNTPQPPQKAQPHQRQPSQQPSQYAPSPQQSQQQPYRVPPQRDIMSLIQNSNARNNFPTNIADFPAVLSSLENSGGNSPLSASQRADMLRLIANENHASNPSAASSSASQNNALITPTPPPMPQNYPSRLASNRAEIDNLVKMQAEQDRSVQNLTNLLEPFSPTGSIPGLGPDGNPNANVPPPPFDVDTMFNDYFGNFEDTENAGQNQGQDTNTTTQGERKPGPHTQGTDPFDFYNSPSGGDTTFGDSSSNNTQQQQPQSSAPGYFDTYPGLDNSGLNDDINFDFGGDGTSGGGIVGAGGNNNENRVTETFTSSEATSPANTSVDENGQGGGAETSAGRSPVANKRRKRNP